MDSYFLTREDFDSIKELGVGPQHEEAVSIDTQTKSTFTRLLVLVYPLLLEYCLLIHRRYNAMNHPVPFMKASAVVGSKAVAKDKPDLEEAMDDEDDAEAPEAAEVADDDEDEDIAKDKYIKKPKAKGAKRGPKKTTKADADDNEDEKPKNRGRKAGGAKGKSKK